MKAKTKLLTMKNKLKILTVRLKVTLALNLIVILLSLNSTAQWTTSGTNIYNSNTGNVGIGTTAPASKFQVLNGESRFGGATNYTKVGSGGNLLFNGTAVTLIANNKYAFKQNLAGNRGLYVNQTSKRFEFRDSSANNLFHVDYYKGDGYFKGRLGIGSTSVPDESNLVLGGNNSTEGGQLQLNSPTSGYTTAWFMDVNQNNLRIMNGTNSGSASVKFAILGPGNNANIPEGGQVIINWPIPTSYAYAYLVVGANSSHSMLGIYFPGGWWFSSDQRLKTNIKPLESALDKIVKLQGVSFNWKSTPNSDNQIGFIAQEVEKVFPEVISKNVGEYYSMAPQNLVGPIVEAIKEQQKEIEEKDETIKYLQSAVGSLQNENTLLASRLQTSKNVLSQCMNDKPVAGSSGSHVNTDIPTLEQISPNRFYEKNIIRCYIPQSASAASVKIYSLAGEEVKSLPVNATGVNELEFAAGTFSSGTYNYLLIVEGKTIDTKKMILTK